MKLIQKIIVTVFAMRVLVMLARTWAPLGPPEVWRQSDTMGVALRYWMRWRLETNSGPWFLPAVLQSGSHVGITPMEFPILNLLLAPCFVLGPVWGQTLAYACFMLLVLGLLLLNFHVWKQQDSEGTPLGLMILLLPLFSFADQWSGKFMPDFISLLLVLLSMGLSWSTPKPWRSGCCAALGILMKPTSVVTLLFLLAKSRTLSEWVKHLCWILPAILIAVGYYTYGLNYIQSFSDISPLFAIQWRHPWVAAIEFLKHHDWLWKLILIPLFFPYGTVLVLALWLGLSWKTKHLMCLNLWILIGLQILAIGALSGIHAYTHPYYFLSVAPTCTLLFLSILSKVEHHRWSWLLLIPTLIRLGELSYMDLRFFHPRYDLQSQCQTLKQRHPEIPWGQAMAFQSPIQHYPELGLCFGERQNAETGPFGFFKTSDPLPLSCLPIDQTQDIQLVRCP